MEEKIVSNASSLIYIAKLDIFDLAKNMFSNILVPKEVIEEIFYKESQENNKIKKELGNFIQGMKVKKILKNLKIDSGEKSAISYCIEEQLPFLSDDKQARKIASSLDIKYTGIIGIILWNLDHKKINKEQTKNLIGKLIEKGYYMTIDLYDEVMRLIEEL